MYASGGKMFPTLEELEAAVKTEDVVNHPSHYTSGNIEVIDFIEDQKLPYHLGNVVKYISRAGKKTTGTENIIVDLKKAEWYLKRYINMLEKENVCND